MFSRTRIRTSPVVVSAASFEHPPGAGKPLRILQSKIQALRLSEAPAKQDRPGGGARSLAHSGPHHGQKKRFTNATGSPVTDNTNIMTAGRRGPALLQDIWLIEKLAHFDREVIPERRGRWATPGCTSSSGTSTIARMPIRHTGLG
jgi:hypothetical protein